MKLIPADTRASLILASVVVALHVAFFSLVPLHYADSGKFEPGYTKYDGAVYDDGQQYAYLANSLIAGKTWLELDVPRWLSDMDNPYDADERARLAKESGEPYYWDYAFYDGRYYCYFGVVPAVLLYVPFKLVTGSDLPTYYAVGFSAAVLCVTVVSFLRAFTRRWFPHCPSGVFLLLFMLVVMGCGVPTQVLYPMFYSLPPVVGQRVSLSRSIPVDSR